MNNIEGNETLSLLELKGKIDLEEPNRTVELSFDLDEKIVEMLDKIVAQSGGKSESEVLQEIIKKDMKLKE